MILTDDEKAVVAVASRLGDAKRPSLSPTAWASLTTRLRDCGRGPASLFESLDGLALDDEMNARLRQLLDSATAALAELDDWNQRGIWLRTPVSEGYPQALVDRLGALAPPVLFGAGDATLLDQPAVGVVGSRNVSLEGAEVAKSVARAAVAGGLGVVSGAARGVDQLAMHAAYDAGGWVAGVLADSLARRIRDSETLAALDQGVLCLVSQQHPRTGFSAGAAMARNKVVYALAQATVVSPRTKVREGHGRAPPKPCATTMAGCWSGGVMAKALATPPSKPPAPFRCTLWTIWSTVSKPNPSRNPRVSCR